MSACKTGCGRETIPGTVICDACCLAWQSSPERERAEYWDGGDDIGKGNVAMVDFCSRMRAERQNLPRGATS